MLYALPHAALMCQAKRKFLVNTEQQKRVLRYMPQQALLLRHVAPPRGLPGPAALACGSHTRHCPEPTTSPGNKTPTACPCDNLTGAGSCDAALQQVIPADVWHRQAGRSIKQADAPPHATI